jgi:type I restriction enzyme S subunit
MNVPRLRFDGFDGEWKIKKLSEIAKISSGGTPNRRTEKYWNGVIPWVTTGEVKFNNIFTSNEYITDLGMQESSAKIFPINTILIAMYGQGKTRGKSAILKIEASTNQACAAIIVNETYDYQLIFQLLSYKYNQLRDLSNDGSQKNLSLGLLGSFKLKIPSLKEEQKKVASFFNFLDQRIEKQHEKIEKLELLIKGIMQKIFSQELRFKDEDGGEFGDWEEKKISQVLKIKHGRDQKKIEKTDGKFPILATGGIIGRTDTFIYDKESVLIGRKGTIDRPVYMNSPFWTVDTLFYSEIKVGFSAKFLFYIFQNINWKLYNEASGVPSLSAKTIEAIKISTPLYEEQKLIANYFSVIDKKIEKEKEKLMVLEEQKKGFMQRMFI